jgi:MFS family permease
MSPAPSDSASAPQHETRTLPPSIWVLGFASLFMDASSELIHSVLPLFLVGPLGASTVMLGFIEGVAEATASLLKVFSGALSDYVGRRKVLMVSGYALAAATKPMFPLAPSVSWVFAARFLDRIGKGIRGAPRDALIAEFTPPPLRGAAYGLRQALDSVGAVVGPLLAVVLLTWLAGDLRLVMWFAVVPAVITVLLLLLFIREPERATAGNRRRLTLRDAGRLPGRYWWVVALGGVFTLARFSEAFLLLRAQEVGLVMAWVPVIMIVLNVVYAGAAYPAGAAADRVSARTLLLFGLGVLIGADVVLAFASYPALVLAGAALWGLHLALTQGLFAKLVADTAPEELLGSAFGVFHLVTGVSLLVASLLAGVLWKTYGPPGPFLAGAGFACLAMLGLLATWRPLRVAS